MGMWRLIFGSVTALSVLGMIYLGFAAARFGGIKKLSRGRKLIGVLISLGITGVLFLVFKLTMSTVNAVMIILHAVLFFLIFGLVFRIVKRVRKKETKHYWQGWLAIGVTAVYLSVGWFLCHHVRQTDYSLSTQKQLGQLKAALIADSHISTTFDGEGFAEHINTIAEQSPDILFIAGDFVDNNSQPEDVERACRALGELSLKYGVWYCSGNHDDSFSRGKDRSLETLLTENGIHILSDSSALIDDRFYVIGRQDKSQKGRRELKDLISGLDTSKYMIVLDHQPSDYEAEAATAADLVLSGHTHGGQLIPATFVGEWLGMNDRTYGYEHRSGTDFIVTSGIADWEIRFKTGTFSEYVIIEISSENADA